MVDRVYEQATFKYSHILVHEAHKLPVAEVTTRSDRTASHAAEINEFSGIDGSSEWRRELGENTNRRLGPNTRACSKDLPIIIAVGSNYTQEPVEIPRCHHRPFAVEDCSTGACKSNCLRGIEHYTRNSKCWAEVGMASSERVEVPNIKQPADFHFVMTNSCLWITKTPWSKIRPQLVQNQLLENNPLFEGMANPASTALHLVELARVLKDRSTLWVAHVSANEHLYCLFKSFARNQEMNNWLLMSNLSHGQDYERLSLIKQYRTQHKSRIKS